MAHDPMSPLVEALQMQGLLVPVEVAEMDFEDPQSLEQILGAETIYVVLLRALHDDDQQLMQDVLRTFAVADDDLIPAARFAAGMLRGRPGDVAVALTALGGALVNADAQDELVSLVRRWATHPALMTEVVIELNQIPSLAGKLSKFSHLINEQTWATSRREIYEMLMIVCERVNMDLELMAIIDIEAEMAQEAIRSHLGDVEWPAEPIISVDPRLQNVGGGYCARMGKTTIIALAPSIIHPESQEELEELLVHEQLHALSPVIMDGAFAQGSEDIVAEIIEEALVDELTRVIRPESDGTIAYQGIAHVLNEELEKQGVAPLAEIAKDVMCMTAQDRRYHVQELLGCSQNQLTDEQQQQIREMLHSIPETGLGILTEPGLDIEAAIEQRVFELFDVGRSISMNMIHGLRHGPVLAQTAPETILPTPHQGGPSHSW